MQFFAVLLITIALTHVGAILDFVISENRVLLIHEIECANSSVN